MNGKRTAVIGLVAFALGLFFGSDADYEPAQITSVKEVPVVEVREIEVPALAGGCADAVDAAVRMQEAASLVITYRADQEEILKRGQQAIAEQDTQLLGLMEAKLKTLSDNTNAASATLVVERDAFDSALTECDRR